MTPCLQSDCDAAHGRTVHTMKLGHVPKKQYCTDGQGWPCP
ncbi:hypothetical protein FHR95_000752 [Halomonas fontilapidosi]|uniref:Uncharacterized protein n=1 Tax=Halomonas fontilapidosi TaxID=616675 RepID=A0A7W5DIF6_9GAMM|nr:hypothetical protein [Halomonas fontilapidosi]